MSIPPVEVSWFAALCDDDYEFLGVPDPKLRSSFAHCAEIVQRAAAGGFDSCLLPSGYELGIDGIAFAGGVAALARQMQLLVAVRCGEMWPPQLARQLATLDQMLGGRLSVNIISSDLPGAPLESSARYARTLEVMQMLKALLAGESLQHRGEHYRVELAAPRLAAERRRRPPFYFGGLSEHAREVAAQAADVFLMWPDRIEAVEAVLTDMRERAARHGRRLRFGYRVHVIVRETEAEARAAASRLLSKLDGDEGDAIRRRSLDHASEGVRRQAQIREQAADDGFVEEQLWTGIGRARSGCGAALVGDPDQILRKLRRYAELGLEAFILSGYPHRDECDLFARYVLPELEHGPLYPAGVSVD
jgi:alkanesulfonate monooxygenase